MAHLSNNNDVSEQKQRQLVALPAHGVLCRHLVTQIIRTDYENGETRLTSIASTLDTKLLCEETMLAGQFSISE